MLERAVTALQANKTNALAEFNSSQGAFRDRDLYVFCSDLNGNITAHPEASLIGAPMTAFVDLDGKRLGVEIMNTATEGKIAQVAYKFPKNGTLVPVEKISFVTKAAGQICGVGFYK
jgi:signal transduction histidine kinase